MSTDVTPKDFVQSLFPNAFCDPGNSEYLIWLNTGIDTEPIGESDVSEELAWHDAKCWIQYYESNQQKQTNETSNG